MIHLEIGVRRLRGSGGYTAAAMIAALLMSVTIIPAAGQTDHVGQSQPPSTDQAATLIVFNDSGPTLGGGKEKLRDGDRTIANLPRHHYQRILISPGKHVLHPRYTRKPEVVLEARPGETYYVVIAYKPERSWAFPFAGLPMEVEQISPTDADALMQKMTEISTDER